MGMPIITSSNTTRCQSITDILESVALEQAALAHILNAEGEKIQEFVKRATTVNEALAVNSSVKSMVKAITQLEMVLQSKIEVFDDCLCVECECTPLLDTNMQSSNPKIIFTKNTMLSYTVDMGLSYSPESGVFTIITTPVGLPISVNGTLPSGVTLSGNMLTCIGTNISAGSVAKLNIGTGNCMQTISIRFTFRIP